MATVRPGNKPGLREVRERPADSVVDRALASAREQFGTLGLGQAELVGHRVLDAPRASFLAVGEESEDRAHQCLEVGDHWAISSITSWSVWWPDSLPLKAAASTARRSPESLMRVARS